LLLACRIIPAELEVVWYESLIRWQVSSAYQLVSAFILLKIVRVSPGVTNALAKVPFTHTPSVVKPHSSVLGNMILLEWFSTVLAHCMIRSKSDGESCIACHCLALDERLGVVQHGTKWTQI
jgi:hypothetical protein